MKFSPDPLADDGLTFFGAARLHARRFDRSIVSSVFLLNASDRLVTDGGGGVLASTDLRRSKSRMAVLSAILVAGLAVVVFAAFFGLLLPGALGVGALVVILVVVAPKPVRAVQAVRRHEVDGTCGLVTDVATEPGRHIGDRLVGRSSQLADEVSAFLVLDVAAENSSATRLYAQSGFVVVSQDRGRITMRRSPNRPSK